MTSASILATLDEKSVFDNPLGSESQIYLRTKATNQDSSAALAAFFFFRLA